jgi:hypothetical protein
MMKYIELKNGRFIAEHALGEIGIDGDEIYVKYMDGQSIAKAYTAKTEPCSVESVIVALRRRIEEKQE